MGSIYRRAGRWRAEARGPRGQRLTSTWPSKAAAQAWLVDTEALLRRGQWRDPDAGALTFREWSEQWLLTRGTLKPSARAAEESICRVHLVPAFGKRRLDDIRPMHVEAFVSKLVADRAAKTVRNVHGQLFAMLEAAVANGLLQANPCTGTRLPKGRRVRPMACLTEQQLERLIAATPDRWRPLVVTLAGTGLRWGEAVGLRVERVDLLGRTLRVEEALNEARAVFTWGPPKSDAGYRTVTLPEAVVDALLPLVAGKDGRDLVFTSAEGGPVRHRNFDTRVWQPACKAAGLDSPRPTIHDLRHTHAALLVAANVPMGAIKVRLGHESITTTMDTYGYLLPRVDEGVIAALDAALGTPLDAEVQDRPTTAPPGTKRNPA